METELQVSQSLFELLLIQAAKQEISVEEIVDRAIRKYIERNDENAV